MSSFELLAISPQLIISLAIVLQMLLIAFKRSTRLIQSFTFICILLAIASSVFSLPALNSQITLLFYLDGFSFSIVNTILFCSAMVVLVSGNYLTISHEVHDEYYLLVMLVTLGALILSISDHFASVFLGLELLSIAVIGLVGYLRDRRQTLEASFKYLILSATASSILLLGMAMLYAYSGDMSFTYIEANLDNSTANSKLFAQAGSILLLVGIAFKLSLAPFHFWTPDVYQGAPAPVTMLLATVSKIAMFSVLIKFWFLSEQFLDQVMLTIISLIAVASMLVGNLLALKQNNIKRLLAYSSIAHMGYLLIILPVLSTSSIEFAKQSVLFYLTAYAVATLILFTFIAETSKSNSSSDLDNWHNWQGLFWLSPIQASAIILALLSLAGIPLSMGFIGKFYLITSALTNQSWLLLASLVVGSSIGLYYYLRIIFIMFAKHIPNGANAYDLSINSSLSHILLFSLTMILLAFGIYPDIYIFL
ncbi:NADH-quinone oxidoreductase subunit N [Thalassomonas sp. M1454]|uniref:NADH-quinone oxidoreductase subunit N n=1 Tax=Thalassomonas sp. M1454 TaxID=2594477 RepID=UPI00117EEF27|nr:NADH-quinone oxidoreductase subunit N [Thalassomonas sp. M1454]TRX55748.1 NADH-quinone oxidoreductase subunit N [Thalassomonas sp. M1454]